MKLENAELNAIIDALTSYLTRNEPNLKRNPPAGYAEKLSIYRNALSKLEEFMQTSGTTCPTATLICPFYSGSKTSDAKAAAARENGKKGGRPRKDAKVEDEEVVGDAFFPQNFK